jgi:hypothetical protein
MSNFLQNAIVVLIIAAAVGYVAMRIVRLFANKAGKCGSCSHCPSNVEESGNAKQLGNIVQIKLPGN